MALHILAQLYYLFVGCIRNSYCSVHSADNPADTRSHYGWQYRWSQILHQTRLQQTRLLVCKSNNGLVYHSLAGSYLANSFTRKFLRIFLFLGQKDIERVILPQRIMPDSYSTGKLPLHRLSVRQYLSILFPFQEQTLRNVVTCG